MKSVVLIVDDEKHTREGLRRALEPRYDVYVADSLESAINVLESESVDVVLTDLRMQETDTGFKLLDRAKTLTPSPVCLMMTAFGSVEVAVEAMKRGAYDYLTKPIDIDRLEILIARALRGRSMETEVRTLRKQVDKKFGIENILGNSPRMKEIFEVIEQVAPSRATVLIEGESGTGKELIAQAIHTLSPRRNSPFVAVHCAALPATLLESELFGHEKGAFTGANEKRIGRFEYADNGTIFLDEIAEIEPQIQTKLLRVLQERSFQRLGSNKTVSVDVRIVAASNKSLEKMVAEGKFREDLYFRLNVVRIELPPLRERVEDIPILANAFLREFSTENGKRITEFSPEAVNLLQTHSWRGNVRELRSAIEHAVVLARGEKITPKDFPPGIRQQSGPGSAAGGVRPGMTLEEMEKAAIVQALKDCGEHRTKAALKL
ncbi:MAG: sigma-54 dependent transcriptional regulator, partial [Verrucomicrobiae bacterium]|nr:sigma-54 dependent transcriptional regulator [Verrucomicrobiae bacterium]